MAQIPTLIRKQIVTTNPDVCDICQGMARVRFPDGSGQLLGRSRIDDPERLRDILFGWLEAHIDAVRKERDNDSIHKSEKEGEL